MIAAFRSLLIAVSVLGVFGPARLVLCQGRVVGNIEKINGPAFIEVAGRISKLDPRRDERRRLHPRETVWVRGNGYLRLSLCLNPNKCEPKEIKAGAKFEIPQPNSTQTEAERRHQQAMEEYGRTGGLPMGVQSPVFSPANNSAVRPGSVVIRWQPTAPMSSFALKVIDTGRQTVWPRQVVAEKSGSLMSDSLRQALLRYRSEHGKGPLILEVEDKNGIGSQSSFSLLTVAEEQDLDRDLGEWDRESDAFLRHLGRANAFYRRSMFNSVADEFAAALAESPESRDLLVRTMLAYRDAGDTAGEQRLKQRLERSTRR